MSGLLPLIQRELRVAARSGPPIRARLKTLGGAAVVAVLLLLVFRQGMRLGMVQVAFGLVAYSLSRGPMLFASDQEAGSQSLLRLAGLNSAAVFWGSLLGSMLLVLEGALLMVPVLITGLWWTGARPQGVVFLILLPIVVLVFGTIMRAVGRLYARSVAAANSIAAGFTIIVVGLPLTLEWLLAPRLGPAGRLALYVWGGLSDWTRIPGTCAGHDDGALVGRLVLRFLLWSLLFGGLATWLFHRQWSEDEGKGLLGRWRDAWGGSATWRRSQLPVPADAVFAWRLRRNRSWGHGIILVTVVLGLGGVLAAVLFPWPALVVTAMGYVAAVDTLLHLAVSQPVAEDRREGAFELLLTTGLEPREVFDGLNAEAQRLRRVADRGGALLLLGLAALSLEKVLGTGPLVLRDWLAWGLTWCWPLAYGLSLRWLSFAQSVWHAANAAAVVHESNPTKTPAFMLLGSGISLWFAVDGTFLSLLPTAILGLVVVVGWLVVRENMAADVDFSDDDLRAVAAQPLPVEQWVPMPKRKGGKSRPPTDVAR